MSSDTGIDAPEEAYKGPSVTAAIEELISTMEPKKAVVEVVEPDTEEVVENEKAQSQQSEEESESGEGREVPSDSEEENEEAEEGESKVEEEAAGEGEGDGDEPESEPGEPSEAGRSELSELKEQNKKLMELLNQQALGQPVTPTVTPATTPAVEATPTAAPTPEVPWVEMPKLTDDQFETLQTDRSSFENYVCGVAQIVRQQASQEIPAIVARQVNGLERIRAFFREEQNADLLPVMDYVQKIAVNVESANPTMNIEQLLEAGAKQAREHLGLSQSATKPPQLEPAKPKFAKTPKRSPRPASKRAKRLNQPKKTGLQSEIDEMLGFKD